MSMPSDHEVRHQRAASRPPGTGDEQSVRHVVAAYRDAWNRHDARAIGALFAGDIEWINIVGMWWRGSSDVELAHRRIHETIFENTPFEIEACSVRFLTSDIAIAVVTLSMGGFAVPEGGQRPPGKDRLSLVMRKRDGAWTIAHGHNTPIDPRAAPFDPVNAGRMDVKER
jgi:uncharacterized protein (TIGR02246 family)